MINNTINISNLSHYFSIPSIPKFSSFFNNFADIKKVNFQSFTAKSLIKNHQNKIFIAVSLTLGVLIVTIYKIKEPNLHQLKVNAMVHRLTYLEYKPAEQIVSKFHYFESLIKENGGIILVRKTECYGLFTGIYIKDNIIHIVVNKYNLINKKFFSENMKLVATLLVKNNLEPASYSIHHLENQDISGIQDEFINWQQENKQTDNLNSNTVF